MINEWTVPLTRNRISKEVTRFPSRTTDHFDYRAAHASALTKLLAIQSIKGNSHTVVG